MRRFLIPALVLGLLWAGPAWAQVPGGVPGSSLGRSIGAGLHSFRGQNSGGDTCILASANPVVLSARQCASDPHAGVGIQQVTLSSNSVMNCITDGKMNQIIRLRVVQPASGPSATLTFPPASPLGAPCFDGSNGASATPILSTTNGNIDEVSIHALSDKVWEVETPTLNYAPTVASPAVTNSGIGTQCSSTGQTTCTASIALTSGDVLKVVSFVCGPNCGTAAPAVSGVAATVVGYLGTCKEYVGAQAAGVNATVDQWWCPIIKSGSPTVQVTWASTGYYQFVFLIDESGGFPNYDDGIGNGAALNGTSSLAVSTNGSTKYAGDLCISAVAQSGGGNIFTPGSGWTTLYNSGTGGGYWIIESQSISGAGTIVTATATTTLTGAAAIDVVCDK